MAIINTGGVNLGGTPQPNPVSVTPTHTQYTGTAPAASTPTRIRMPWEAAPGMTADQLASSGTPNPGATMAQPAPTQSTASWGWNSGANPFAQNVTATDMTGNTQSFGSANPNYLTQDAASRIAQMTEANLVGQNTGLIQGGSVSSPMFGLDFGAGDIQDPGAIMAGLNRGDRIEDILARIRAGIAPPGGMAQREDSRYMGNQWNMNNPLAQNLAAGQVSSLAGGKANMASNSPFANLKPSTHLGAIGGARPTPFGPSGAQSPATLNAMAQLLNRRPQGTPAQPGVNNAFGQTAQQGQNPLGSLLQFLLPLLMGGGGGSAGIGTPPKAPSWSIAKAPSGFTRWIQNFLPTPQASDRPTLVQK